MEAAVAKKLPSIEDIVALLDQDEVIIAALGQLTFGSFAL